jgi:hypothetical protein
MIQSASPRAWLVEAPAVELHPSTATTKDTARKRMLASCSTLDGGAIALLPTPVHLDKAWLFH